MFRSTFFFTLVLPIVIGVRVRVQPHNAGSYQYWPPPAAGVDEGPLHRGIACQSVCAIHGDHFESGERRHQSGDIAAWRLDLDWDRDSVAVVFDQEDNRQASGASRIEGLPEFTLAGRAITE